ncbi:MAG: DUF4159 domain-containing protein [Armatimonadota bacterium]
MRRSVPWLVITCALCLIAALTVAVPAGAEELVGRLKYGGGGDWYANPSSLPNLLEFAREHTSLDLPKRAVEVEPSAPELHSFAFVHATGHGRIRFTDAERRNLREYLLGGGFLHVDDNYGLDESFREEVRALFPGRELVELPFSHPIYHCLFEFPRGLPKIHEHDGGPPHGYGIIHEGRVVLFYSYNTDLGDGWESPGVHNDPEEVRLQALRMGTNLLVYALSR